MLFNKIPDAVFHTRVLNEDGEYEWKDVTTADLFNDKRVVVFALPGAFTPTCSTYQLPGFEEKYDEFTALGIDAVYCLSVNDSFVMNAWFKSLGIEKVQAIPDGGAELTSGLAMEVNKANLGFGMRSWRYAMVVDNGNIEKTFEEEGKVSAPPADEDPYEVSTPENVLAYLSETDDD